MDILSELTLQNSVSCFRLASFLKTIPFKLSEPGRLSVRLFEAPWRLCLWYLVSTTVLANSLYQIISFFWAINARGLTSETAVHMFYVCIASLAMLYFVPTLLMPKQAAAMINQLDFLHTMSHSKGLFLSLVTFLDVQLERIINMSFCYYAYRCIPVRKEVVQNSFLHIRSQLPAGHIFHRCTDRSGSNIHDEP